jgi:phage terminase large subunit-like protein
MVISTACPDWRERILSGRSLVPPPLHTDEADISLDIFKSLRIADIPGCPTMGESCNEWIFDTVRSVFGAYDGNTGRRDISEWLISVSKKNFKSGLAAGIMMTALIRNWRESAEYGILAPTVEVANNSFFPARDMIRKDEELSDLFQVQDHIRTITHRTSRATLKVIAAENETVGGKKFTGVLFDELWLFGKRPNAGDMMREATGGLASRPEGFVISLTTMSNEAPAGVFKQKLDYARQVRDGKIADPKFVPILYEFPESMLKDKSCRDPKNWHITNPNMGASVDMARLMSLHQQADAAGEEELIGFFAKHVNVEIGLAMQSDRWTGADFWDACAVERIELNELLERSDVVDVGIDGGGLDDLLGLAVLGRDSNTGKWLLWARAWAHPSVLERRKSEAARFKDFARDGDLILVKNIGDDVTEVAEIVEQVENSGKLDKVGVDPHGLGGILDALVEIGVPQDKVIGISQGWKMSGAIKTAERRVAEGNFEHSGSPMMRWCVGNAKIEPRGNAVIVTKQASGYAKIDPLLAVFNAVSLMSLVPEATGTPYNEMGVYVG